MESSTTRSQKLGVEKQVLLTAGPYSGTPKRLALSSLCLEKRQQLRRALWSKYGHLEPDVDVIFHDLAAVNEYSVVFVSAKCTTKPLCDLAETQSGCLREITGESSAYVYG